MSASNPPVVQVAFTNDCMTITPRGHDQAIQIEGANIKQIRAYDEGLHAKLTVITHEDALYSVGGINKEEALKLKGMIVQAIERHREAAKQNADKLSSEIIRTEQEAKQLLSPSNYLRHRITTKLVHTVVAGSATNRGVVEEFLSPEASASLGNIRAMMTVAGIEPDRQQANRNYVQKQIPRVKSATGDISVHGLTDEQATAVATDEDVTLVLAGAGTGKTAVITAKVAHLIRNQAIPPNRILVLAFNRDAAQEIQERLPHDLQEVSVSTFHAFGVQVLKAQGTRPTVSTLATDSYQLSKFIETVLEGLVHDPEVGTTAIRLMANMPADYKTPFDFKTEQEYRRYIREVELRALSGDLVKSFEELEIANWLTQNGVPFQYERAYPEKTATRERRQYQPDFWLPNNDIYIEHFALDEKGRAPRDWPKYEEGVRWKRQRHRKYGTTLVETHSWQHREQILLPTLKEKLQAKGVAFHPISRDRLIAKLGSERISSFSTLLCAFLHHTKSANLTDEELLQRSENAGDRKRADAFLQVFRKVRKLYQRRLTDEQAVDFHDLINQATTRLKEEAEGFTYSHVLVDEFQDISNGRMELLRALRKRDTSYFLVGDDWQSIYRFTGSRLSLVQNVAQHLGHTQRETLTQTFRFGKKILEPSSHFIKQNPEQTRQTLQPNANVNDQGITTVVSRDAAAGLAAALKDLTESEGYETSDSIMVLGRFRYSKRALHTQGPSAPDKVIYRTVHSAKGQEADYVVILDLRDSKHGFPCKVEDDPLLKLVLPPVEDGEYEYAEERRLFYVALTRARKGVYLVVDERQPSPFAMELLRIPEQEIRQINKLMPPCPRCLDGTLRESRSQENLRCSNHPDCRYLSPICPDCKVGFVSISQAGEIECSNPDCRTTQTICPSCDEGILVKRVRRSDGRPFLGCSRFADEPPCHYVES